LRKLLSSFVEHTQFTKSWLVAIGRPITTMYPTDAVRERQTVCLGKTLAEELAIPISFVYSAVSVMTPLELIF
jgi:hypothetical protein